MVVVGAPGEAGDSTGVNGNQSDDNAPDSGAAYVFVCNGSVWSQQGYLKASNTGAGDSFGTSVAVSADAVVVGAPYEASSATGVNGDQSDNILAEAGAAYLFVIPGAGPQPSFETLETLVKQFVSRPVLRSVLLAEVQLAETLFNRGQIAYMDYVLRVFVYQVSSQSGKLLTPDQGQILIKQATGLIQ